jgi:16S rRNA (guanine527-N7)-methyltransferase
VVEETLRRGALELGIELGDRQISQFSAYTALLLEWNKKFNLTRITDPVEITVKHYLDSLTCLAAAPFPEGALVADVGTGAGFPGVPLAIARPDLRLVLIEATRKKLSFLEALRQAILSQPPSILSLSKDGAPRVELVHARAEDAARLPEHRERYDVVVARAVARMPILVEYCLPLVKVGGTFIAMKGPDIESELAAAQPRISALGGEKPEVARLTLPGTDIHRSLVVVKKVKPTPARFPRRGARIGRNARPRS